MSSRPSRLPPFTRPAARDGITYGQLGRKRHWQRALAWAIGVYNWISGLGYPFSVTALFWGQASSHVVAQSHTPHWLGGREEERALMRVFCVLSVSSGAHSGQVFRRGTTYTEDVGDEGL